jgi:hypothetical protein
VQEVCARCLVTALEAEAVKLMRRKSDEERTAGKGEERGGDAGEGSEAGENA